MGNDLFTLIILIGAYLNSNILSGLLMKSALWSYDRNVVRQMTLKKTRAEVINNFILAPFLPLYTFAALLAINFPDFKLISKYSKTYPERNSIRRCGK